MRKFMFFSFKKSWFLNTLIILSIVLWIILCTQLISLINFKGNFQKYYEKYLPISDGYVISLNLFQLQDISNKEDKIKDVISYIKNNTNIDYFYVRKNFVSDQDIEIDPSKYRRYYKSGSEQDDHSVYLVEMNYGYINYLKNYIDKNIEENNWSSKDNEIPVILGYNYKKDFKSGDTIKYKDKNLKVIAFLTESVMYSNGVNPVDYSEYLDDAIISPIELKVETFSYEPISIISKDSSDRNKVLAVKEYLENIDKNINVISYKETLEKFLIDINSRRENLLFQTLVISILSLIIINNIILHKIHINKDNIGVLYSVGANKRYITSVLFKEFMLLILVGILISIPITYNLTRVSIYFFYNESRGFTLITSIILLLTLIIATIKISFKNLDKLTPRQLIGGFRK